METKHFFRNALSLLLCVLMLAEFAQPTAMAAFRPEQTQESGETVSGADRQTQQRSPVSEETAPDAALPTGVKPDDANEEADPRWNADDIIIFGWYPQDLVKAPDLIDLLDAQPKTWKSYGYYRGSATAYSIAGSFVTENFDGRMKPGRLMQFADLLFYGRKYRAVMFSEYRPKTTGMTTVNDANPNNPYLLDNSYQDDNGYQPGTVYYFTYEPIYWYVLDRDSGLIMTAQILDAQAYQTTVWFNFYREFGLKRAFYKGYGSPEPVQDYASSAIRDWLNYDFYYTAFSEAQRANILPTGQNEGEELSDKVFLLSEADVTNSAYGFNPSLHYVYHEGDEDYNDHTRMAYKLTHYAKSQGLKDGSWWLSDEYGEAGKVIDARGWGDSSYINDTSVGVRCACRLQTLLSDDSLSDELFSEKDDAAAGRIIDPAINGVISISALVNDWTDTGSSSTDASLYRKLTDYTVTPDDGGFEKYDYNLPYDTAVQTTVKVSADGYQDYLIPKEVSSTLRDSLLSCDGVMNICLSPDTGSGKPYVSTVYARATEAGGAYKEITRSFFDFYEGISYDIIVTAQEGEGVASYYLWQDDNHKLVNDSGHFRTVLADTFDDSKPLFAFVERNGVRSEYAEILLEQTQLQKDPDVAEMANSGSFNAIGDITSFSFADAKGKTIRASYLDFLKNGGIDLSALKVPISVMFHGNKLCITLGVSLFGMGGADEVHYDSVNGESDATATDWGTYHNFVQDFKDHYSDFSSNTKESYEKARALRANYDKKGTAAYTKYGGSADIVVLGYMELEYRNGKYVLTEGYVGVGGAVSAQMQTQAFLGPVPAYFYFKSELSLTMGASFEKKAGEDLTISAALSLKPAITFGGGVGIKDLLSVGIYGTASLPTVFKFKNKQLTMDIQGEIGVEASALYIFKYSCTLWSGSKRLIDKTWKKGINGLPMEPAAILDGGENPDPRVSDVSIRYADRDYAAYTSPWLGDQPALRGSHSSALRQGALRDLMPGAGIDATTLQTGVFEGSTPQLVSVGDTMLMVFVQDDPDRDDYNRMRLVYSLYDPDTKTWFAPQPVYDDGCNDVYPTLVSDGENAYVVWQKICSTLTADVENAGDAFKATELYLAAFDPATGTFHDARQLTDDSTYNYAQTIGISGGKPVVYYAACTDNNPSGNGNTEILRWTEAGAETLLTGKNYIHQLQTDETGAEFVYLTDLEDDSAVMSVFRWQDDGEQKLDLEFTATGAAYADLDGTQTLLLLDQFGIYQEMDGVWTPIFDTSGTTGGGLRSAEVNGDTVLCWTQVEADGTNNLYYAVFRDGAWSDRVQITAQNDLISYVDVACFDSQLFGALMQTDLSTDDDGNPVYGLNDLCIFSFADYADLEVFNLSAIERNLNAGEDSEIGLAVKNNGSLTVTQIEFHITDGLGTNVTQTQDIVLAPGEWANVTLQYPVPADLSKTGLTVTATPVNLTDANLNNHTATKEVGVPDLYFANMNTMLCGDGYLVEGYLYNASDVEAHNLSVGLQLNTQDAETKTFFTCDKLRQGQVVHVQAEILKEDLTYDEDGVARIYLIANSTDGDAYPDDNTEMVVLHQMEIGHSALEAPPKPIVNPFTDIQQNAYYYIPVLWAANAEPVITVGTGATTFSPNRGCTRAQVVTFLWRAYGQPETDATENPFTDVKEDAYYYKAVLWAVRNGITVGTGATTFSPNAVCTRAQVVTFLWRTHGNPEPTSSNSPFKDVTGGYYCKAVLWAAENGVTAGTSETTFSPDQTCTRAQIVTFLYRDMTKE